jgi:hypothetical protein
MAYFTVAVLAVRPSPSPSPSVSAHGTSPTVTLLIALAALVVGVVAGTVVTLWRSRRSPLRYEPDIPRQPAPVASPRPPTPARADPAATLVRADPPGLATAQAERARLVEACAELADRLRDHQPGLFTVLSRDLKAVGITMQVPDGEYFSADRHNPVGIEKTSDPDDNMRVAATTRLGYTDHGVTVRVPDVIVYRSDGADHAT